MTTSASPIEVISKRVDINRETFQPIMTVTLEMKLTLESIQDHGYLRSTGQYSVHFSEENYTELGKELMDAIRDSKNIPTDSPIEAFRHDPS